MRMSESPSIKRKTLQIGTGEDWHDLAAPLVPDDVLHLALRSFGCRLRVYHDEVSAGWRAMMHTSDSAGVAYFRRTAQALILLRVIASATPIELADSVKATQLHIGPVYARSGRIRRRRRADADVFAAAGPDARVCPCAGTDRDACYGAGRQRRRRPTRGLQRFELQARRADHLLHVGDVAPNLHLVQRQARAHAFTGQMNLYEAVGHACQLVPRMATEPTIDGLQYGPQDAAQAASRGR